MKISFWVEVVKEHNKGDVVLENTGQEWRGANQRVLKYPPCSVVVLVDRGFGTGSKTMRSYSTKAERVRISFFGWSGDPEALEQGKKMVDHPVLE